MRDPLIVAHEIRYPWKAYRNPRNEFEKGYRRSFITIWHRDPESDGSDDSCGWFMRARHGKPEVLEKIKSRFAFDWDRDFDGRYCRGYFEPVTGKPVMSTLAIALSLFQVAAFEVFGSRDAANTWMRRNMADILLFAENPIDSMRDAIEQTFGDDEPRDRRIESFAHMIYGWILRSEQKWYQHPRWHVRHWEFQVHPWQTFRRWLLDRCAGCGKRFTWGYSPTSHTWDAPRPRWFRGATHLFHSECSSAAMKERLPQ